MAASYKFAVVRLAPNDARDERLNIGIVVFGEDNLDVRLSRRLEKTRSISGALDVSELNSLTSKLSLLDERNRNFARADLNARIAAISRIGPLSLSAAGTFTADGADAYEARIASIMRNLVDPEAALARKREKRSKLVTQVKSHFRQNRVLARKDEDLTSHRIVPGYALDEGLVADFVLKNGAMHVVETVDASGEDETLRRAIGDIGVAALVLARARMKFGSSTKARLVYNASSSLEQVARPSLDTAASQGAELVNWASANERTKFINTLSSLAIPFTEKHNSRAHIFTPPRLPFA